MYKEKEILIYQAVFELFQESGFYETKIQDIAKKAGIGKGTVYEYFSSKEEIFKGMIIYMFDQYMEILIKEVAQEASALAKLEKLLEVDVSFFGMQKGNYPFFEQLRSIKSLDIQEIFEKTMLRKVTFLHELLEAGIGEGSIKEEDPSVLATLFIGSENAMFGAVHMGYANDEYLQKMVTFLLSVVQKPS